MQERWTVLVVIAHPDDETACGGTIAKLAEEGHRVVVAVATNGNKGTHDPAVTPEMLSQMRVREMEQACAALGVSKLIRYDYDDGALADSPDLKERIYRTIREEKPDILITFDPWRKYEFHPDHRTVGMLAAEAAYLADGCWYFPQHAAAGLMPCKPQEVYLFWSDEPNYTVDVAATWERKLRAADAHASQGTDGEPFGTKYLNWLRANAASEAELRRETFRKVYRTSLTI
ncbi:PIG-L deacetylase family protein [Gordoniibacillus kamchatkensis]|uniref:PIG-L deacetylase family protein n=1 Tax=Gordoniibacillus kamchatkensis TaxID=1590651 RepID=UPI000696D2EE|nr:PIG-L deacetylase family protein [Paenibacillus sp. VKM B-2647]